MDVYILNKNYKSLESKLRLDLPGYNIRVFPNVEAFFDYVTKTAVIADMFIVTDSGVDNPDLELSTSFNTLRQLFEYSYFEPKSIMFLNKSENVVHKDKYDFLVKILTSKGAKASLISRKQIDYPDLEGIITQSTVTFRAPVTNKKAVVQVVRGSKALSTKVLPTYSTEETIAIALNKIDTVSQLVKETHAKNETPLEFDSEEDNIIEELPDDLEITFDDTKKEYKHVKYITVTGEGGTGVSTTALTLAMNGCLEDRTLLIDADIHLGLSNLVERILPETKYYGINLEKVLKDKDKAIEEILNANTDANLHIMQVTLPTVRAVGRDVLEYIILNLLSLIQDNYKYIIIDLPVRILEYYSTILSKSDLIISSCPPYLNKAVQLLRTVQFSNIIKSSKAYKNGLFMVYMTGIPDLNKLDPMSIREFKVYSQSILGKEIPCTNPYICIDNQYIAQDRFRAIIEKADTIFNREGVE